MARNKHKSAGTLRYDIVRSEMHQKDKFAQSLHPKTEWLWVHDRENCALAALHFGDFEIPEVKLTHVAPEPWEHSGCLASFSAGSEVAVVLEFLRKSSSTDRKPESDPFNESLMKALPSSESPKSALSKLAAMTHAAFVISLALLRDKVQGYHQWTTGNNGKMFWKKRPFRTGYSDLARYTVTCHPALGRAMVLMLEQPDGEAAVQKIMNLAAESVIAAFEQITGRRVVGLSIDFHGGPCWNVWHSGLERVIYKVSSKGSDRVRYRRTPFRLNETGSALVACDRIRRSFQKMGTNLAL